jgi:hypothetical protein
MSMIGNYVRVSPGQLAELRANPDSIADFLYPADGAPSLANHLDVDKMWHAIHFLLNGDTWEGEVPVVNAVLGGEPIGEVDVGYGPARFLKPGEVRALAEALSDIPADELLARFDPTALNDADVYPQGWSGNPHDREYIASNYRQLVAFLRAASENGEAVIVYLN